MVDLVPLAYSAAEDTIFALSSGSPPAAIAVVRISGPAALAAFVALGGEPDQPARHATLRTLIDPESGAPLDRALTLLFRAPASVTREDMVELHLHGGRAVVAAVERALLSVKGLRPAEPGEFTRRAFRNGALDLNEAESLADLLSAETEQQRRAALAQLDGAFSRQVAAWREALIALAAEIEASLDFADESEVAEAPLASAHDRCRALADALAGWAARPSVEPLRRGIKVVIAGPPNAGKSSLLNALCRADAAIVSDIAGTTRDLIEVPVNISGLPFVLVDGAGLRDSDDMIEAIGIARARQAMAVADILLWLGASADRPQHPSAIQLAPKYDLGRADAAGLPVSAKTGEGIDALLDALVAQARAMLPADDRAGLNARQQRGIDEAAKHLQLAATQADLLLLAEEVRLAQRALASLVGDVDCEDVLDAVFARFCIGK